MSRPLRVAVVTGEILPWETDIWSACHRAGVDVTLIGRRTEPGPAAECPVRFFQPRALSRRSQNIWWLYPGLGRLLTELSPDVIHVHSEAWGLLVQQSLLSVARHRLHSVVCAHGADNIFSHGPHIEQDIRAATLRVLLPRLGGYASWNTVGITLARRYGLPSDSPTTVLPGVAYFAERFPEPTTEDRRRARASFGIPQDRLVIGFVGRLVPEKGVGNLADAVTILDREDIYLQIWGTGPLEGSLESRRRRGEFRGSLGGWLHFSMLPAALAAADVVAVPSYSTPTVLEQFSRVGLEAMLSRSAIVATSTGAFPDVFGDAALLVPERDVTALSSALLKLCAEPSLRLELGQRAHDRAVEGFAPERLVADHLNPFWEEAVARRNGSHR